MGCDGRSVFGGSGGAAYDLSRRSEPVADCFVMGVAQTRTQRRAPTAMSRIGARAGTARIQNGRGYAFPRARLSAQACDQTAHNPLGDRHGPGVPERCSQIVLTIIEIPHLDGWVQGGTAAVAFEIEFTPEGLSIDPMPWRKERLRCRRFRPAAVLTRYCSAVASRPVAWLMERAAIG